MLGFSRRWVSWQIAKNILIGLGVFALFFLLYLWRLGNIVPGLSPYEAAARTSSGSFRNIMSNPLNAPHKTLQFVFQILGFHGAFWMRIVSVLFALIFIFSMYFLLLGLYGKLTALAGTLLFAATPWVVLSARNASADVMMLSSVLIIFAYLAFKRAEKYANILWFIFIISLAVCLDTPALVWLLLIALILEFNQLTKTILKLDRFVAIMGLVVLMILTAPLFYAMAGHGYVAKQWLGIPSNLPNIPSLISLFPHTASALFYQIDKRADYSVGKFAVLSIAQVIIGLIGIIALRKKSVKGLMVALWLIVMGIIIAVVNSNLIFLMLCLPGVAILDAIGLKYLYEHWFSVFPFNPLARGFAVAMISLLLLGQLAYGLRYALLAWPHNMETRKEYVIK
jgi:4-amino-4-deoxy-L-arabinose transferase-like glycosyltransferase